MRGGFVGVDVFFVISGFLITRQLLDSVGAAGIRALPTFYTRRIKRLLPAAATVVIATVLVARVVWAPALQVRSIATDGVFTTFYGLNYRLAIEGTQYLHQGDAVSPLQHFWSLGVEEQFYVSGRCSSCSASGRAPAPRRPARSSCWPRSTAVSFYCSVTVTRHVGAVGLLLAAHPRLGARRWAPWSRSAPSGWRRLPGRSPTGRLARPVARGRLGLRLQRRHAYPGSLAAVPVVGAALVIAAGCGAGAGRAGPGRAAAAVHRPRLLLLVPLALADADHDPDHRRAPADWLGRLGVVWLSLVAAIAHLLRHREPGAPTTADALAGSIGVVISRRRRRGAVLVIANLPACVGTGAAVTVVAASSTPAVLPRCSRPWRPASTPSPRRAT